MQLGTSQVQRTNLGTRQRTASGRKSANIQLRRAAQSGRSFTKLGAVSAPKRNSCCPHVLVLLREGHIEEAGSPVTACENGVRSWTPLCTGALLHRPLLHGMACQEGSGVHLLQLSEQYLKDAALCNAPEQQA